MRTLSLLFWPGNKSKYCNKMSFALVTLYGTKHGKTMKNLSVVPKNWIRGHDVYWPPKNTLKSVEKKLQEDASGVPDLSKWRHFPCKVRVNDIETFAEGLDLEIEYANYSDTEAEKECVPKRFKTNEKSKDALASQQSTSQIRLRSRTNTWKGVSGTFEEEIDGESAQSNVVPSIDQYQVQDQSHPLTSTNTDDSNANVTERTELLEVMEQRAASNTIDIRDLMSSLLSCLNNDIMSLKTEIAKVNQQQSTLMALLTKSIEQQASSTAQITEISKPINVIAGMLTQMQVSNSSEDVVNNTLLQDFECYLNI